MEKPSTSQLTDLSIEEIHGLHLKRIEEALTRGDVAMMLSVVEELEEYDHPLCQTSALLGRSRAESTRGDLKKALSYADEASELAALTGLHQLHLDSMSFMGVIYWRAGQLPQAVTALERGLGYAKMYLPDGNVATLLGNLGLVYATMGDFPKALEYLHRQLDEDNGPLAFYNAAIGHLNIGMVYASAGDTTKALEHLERALEGLQDSKNERAIIGCMQNMAPVLNDLGRYEESLSICSQASERAMTTGDPLLIQGCLFELASVQHIVGSHDEARATLDRLSDHRPLLPLFEVGALALHAQMAQNESKLDDARMAFETAVVLAQEHGFLDPLSKAYNALIDICKGLSDFDGYVKYNELQRKTEEEIRGAAVHRSLEQQKQRRELEVQREQVDLHRSVVLATLPDHVASRIMRGERVFDNLPHVAVLFSDVAGFTSASSMMNPAELVSLLESLFVKFDAVVRQHGALKIKTIGDAYMCIATDASPLAACTTLAQVALDLSQEHFAWPDGKPLSVRFGMHVGPATAGVIGTERLQYDVWGDTVNVASRMESTGEAGRIHVSEAVARELAPLASVVLTPRGLTLVKGKGVMNTFWLERRQPQ